MLKLLLLLTVCLSVYKVQKKIVSLMPKDKQGKARRIYQIVFFAINIVIFFAAYMPEIIDNRSQIELAEMNYHAKITNDTIFDDVYINNTADKLTDDSLKRAKKGIEVATFSAAKYNKCRSISHAFLSEYSVDEDLSFIVNCRASDAGIIQFRFDEHELEDNNGEWYSILDVPTPLISYTEQLAIDRDRLRNQLPGSVSDCLNAVYPQREGEGNTESENILKTSDDLNDDNERIITIDLGIKNFFDGDNDKKVVCEYNRHGLVKSLIGDIATQKY